MHMQYVRRQLTFQSNSSHLKYVMFLLQSFDYGAWCETLEIFRFSNTAGCVT